MRFLTQTAADMFVRIVHMCKISSWIFTSIFKRMRMFPQTQALASTTISSWIEYAYAFYRITNDVKTNERTNRGTIVYYANETSIRDIWLLWKEIHFQRNFHELTLSPPLPFSVSSFFIFLL